MPQGTVVSALRHLAALALIASADATAWDWRVDAPTPPPVAFQPEFIAPAPDGYWAGGDSLVRYDRQSRAQARAAFDRNAWLVALPGGGVLAAAEAIPSGWEPLPVPCTLEGFGEDGRALWRSDALPGVDGCDAVAVSAQGVIWVGYRDGAAWKLQAFDERGAARGSLALTAPLRDLIADPTLARAYVLSGSQLLTLGDRAQLLSSTGTERAGAGRLALGPGRQLLLAEPGNGGLHLLRLDLATGARSDQRLATTPPAQSVEALASDAAGQFYVLERAATFTLRRLGPDGAVAWSAPLDAGLGACAALHGRCSLYPDSEGVLVPMLRAAATPAGASSLALERYAGTGSRRGGSVLDADRLRGVVPLADGSSLAVASRDPRGLQPPPQTLRLSRDGTAVPVPSPVDGVARAQAVAALATPGGDSYLLSDAGAAFGAASERRHTLTALSPDGSLRWRTTAPGYWDAASVLAAGADRVCIGGSRYDAAAQPPRLRIQCADRASGQMLWERDLGEGDFASATVRIGLLADGSVVALARAAGTGSDSFDLRHLRFGATGALQHDERLGTAPWNLASAVFGSGGDALLLQDAAHLARIDAGGAKRYAVALPGNEGSPAWPTFDAAVAADGSAVVLLLRDSALAWSVGPDGATRWSRPLEASAVASAALRRAGEAVDVVTTTFDTASVSLQARVRRLRAADGAVVWNVAVPEAASSRLASSEATTVLLVGSAAHALRLRWLDPANGASLAVAGEPCAEVACAFLAPSVGADGMLRLGLAGSDLPTPALVARRGTLPATPAVALDQHALGGTWYASYENGQGFQLDVLMPQRVFFMPWFTYTAAGGNDPAALRWYTLQGDIPAGARQLELGIYANRGGAFDAPPATLPQRVGTARVRFDSCDRGSLHYRFDGSENGGREGDITLSRLLPRNESCLQGDGSLAPPTVATPPKDGFDARLSGSWFTPATGGQGVQLTLQPGGVLFGGWFTYDPAGAGNDPGQQHWLTLQGSLAAAHDGVAEVAIVQALGGRFDGAPTGNQYIVGQATITALACDRLRLDYRFDDRAAAGAYRARSGRLDLVKIGGCTP